MSTYDESSASLLYTTDTKDRFGKRRAETVRAVNAGGIVGRFVIEFFYAPDRPAYLEDIWIEKEHRGKGFGSALLDKAVSVARSNGAQSIQCDPIPYHVDENGNHIREDSKRESLRNWYIKQGFRPIPDDPTELLELHL